MPDVGGVPDDPGDVIDDSFGLTRLAASTGLLGVLVDSVVFIFVVVRLDGFSGTQAHLLLRLSARKHSPPFYGNTRFYYVTGFSSKINTQIGDCQERTYAAIVKIHKSPKVHTHTRKKAYTK